MNKPKGDKFQGNKLWKDSMGGLQKMTDNYLEMLAGYFHKMSRFEQEELITKYSWIITFGGVSLIWCQIYNFVIPVLRVIGLPLSLAVAYWFGKTIVSRIMIDRMSKFLK